MKNLSCSMTTEQVRARQKTVTRRMGWWDTKRDCPRVKPGEYLRLVEKGMGLKAGEHPVELAVVEVVSVTRERLGDITPEEVAREGFPGWHPGRFILFFMQGHGIEETQRGFDTLVTRIEWRYLDGEVAR